MRYWMRTASFREKWVLQLLSSTIEFVYWRNFSAGLGFRTILLRDMVTMNCGLRHGCHLYVQAHICNLSLAFAIPLPFIPKAKKQFIYDLENLPPPVVMEAEPLVTMTLSIIGAEIDLFWKALKIKIQNRFQFKLESTFGFYAIDFTREETITYYMCSRIQLFNLELNLSIPLWREANPKAAKA